MLLDTIVGSNGDDMLVSGKSGDIATYLLRWTLSWKYIGSATYSHRILHIS